MTVRVLLADDDALLRAGVAVVLGTADGIEVVAEAGDGLQAVALCRSHTPDVVVMDVRMPGIDGIEATRRIVAAGLPTRVLVLTTFHHDEYVWGALRAGASGFLLKRARPEEIIQALRTVALSDSLLFPAAIRGLAALHAGRGADRVAQARLTEREGEVLELMAKGLSNAEIAAVLVVSVETIKTHVGNILAKLQARDRTQAVIAAYESGFVSPS
jgi:DNA-binding NarL/FixJ family response regulator